MRVLVVTAVVAAACGGSSTAPPDGRVVDGATDAPNDAIVDAMIDANEGTGFRIGGTAYGIRGSARIALDTNLGHRELLVTQDGTFRFSGKFANPTPYTVTTNDPRCRVLGGSGTLDGANVTSVELYCIGVVELKSITFAPSIITIAPAYDPGLLTYGGTRPLFMEATDPISATPIAAYPALPQITVFGQLTASGSPSTPAPLGTVTLTHAASGLAQVYTFLPSTLVAKQEAYVKPHEASTLAHFSGGPISDAACGGGGNNNGIAVTADTLVVGAPCANSGRGTVYVYRRAGTTWTYEATLTAASADANDQFGASVTLSGDTLVVGVPYEDSGSAASSADNSAAGAGAAYVFVRSGTTWSQQAYLKASNLETGDNFGFSVAIDVDTIVVGAPNEDSAADGVGGSQTGNTAADAGAAYVFVRSGTTWSQQAYVKAPASDAGDAFGYSVAISANTFVGGTPVDAGAANNLASSGAAHVYTRAGTTWSFEASLRASNADAADFFGWAVAIDSNLIVVGAPDENGNGLAESDNSKQDAGAAYVFERSGTTWTQRCYLKATNVGINDEFGTSVAISRANIVVGAPHEEGSATGVDGIPDDSLPNLLNNSGAGAAYAYRRTATNAWADAHYIKASNTGGGDNLGTSVAAFRDTFAVGAPSEDSASLDVNGVQANEGAPNSGAVYVFR